MSLLDQSRRLNHLAAAGGSGLSRAALYPVTVTLSTDTSSRKIPCSGSPVSRQRVQDEMRGGWVKQTVRTFMLLPSQIPAGVTVDVGTVFTVVADPVNPQNVGTIWSCNKLTDSSSGGELGFVCFRKDS